MAFLEQTPEISRIFREAEALTAAMEVVEKGSDRTKAQELVLPVFKDLPTPKNLPNLLVALSMRRILGKRLFIPGHRKFPTTQEKAITQGTCLAWMILVEGYPRRAARHIEAMRSKKLDPRGTNAINLLSLKYWGDGIYALARGYPEDSFRFFQRALDLASQNGTESHPLISWSYAATFFYDRSGSSPVIPPKSVRPSGYTNP